MKENVNIKELKSTIEYKGIEYDLVFNLNVMEEIQTEYGTLSTWSDLVMGENKEADIKALIFGILTMLNEGIDIYNEENNLPRNFFTKKQVGRMITELGLDNVTGKVTQTIIESTKSDSKNA